MPGLVRARWLSLALGAGTILSASSFASADPTDGGKAARAASLGSASHRRMTGASPAQAVNSASASALGASPGSKPKALMSMP